MSNRTIINMIKETLLLLLVAVILIQGAPIEDEGDSDLQSAETAYGGYGNNGFYGYSGYNSGYGYQNYGYQNYGYNGGNGYYGRGGRGYGGHGGRYYGRGW